MSKITRADIAATLVGVEGIETLSPAQIEAVIALLAGEVATHVAKGREVFLTGFGTFRATERAARIGRNPKTGEEAAIPARRGVAFKPAAALKRVLNGDAPAE